MRRTRSRPTDRTPVIDSRRVRALLASGILLGTGAIGTTALWSTSPQTTSGQFSTGFIDIRMSQSSNNTDPNATKNLAVAFPGSLLPGNKSAVMVSINNRGTVPFTVTMSAKVDAVFAGAFDLAAFSPNGTGGLQITNGSCTAVTGSPTAWPVKQLNTNDQQVVSGTTAVPVGAGGWQPMCLEMRLRTDAPDTAAGKTATATLTYTATST